MPLVKHDGMAHVDRLRIERVVGEHIEERRRAGAILQIPGDGGAAIESKLSRRHGHQALPLSGNGSDEYRWARRRRRNGSTGAGMGRELPLASGGSQTDVCDPLPKWLYRSTLVPP